MNCPKCDKPLWIKLDEHADPRNLKPEEVWIQCSDVSHCDYGEWLVDVYGERPILLEDHDKLTAENERLEADLKAWPDREANIDEQLAKQRAVPSSALVRELQAAAVEYAVIGMAPGTTAASLIEDAAARIDALEQETAKAKAELADLRELRKLVEARDALMSERASTKTYNEWFDQLRAVESEIHSHVHLMREGDA